ncbi:hypothetical protein V6N11_026763 [Hibiscus sabdariffa]|uniref:Non-haem dioxygenase N-terminal domain-containing protein n=1 Tax=Hibiscus sabdariffa TaxID=183260 RepID=A0ABR2SWL7_9ROSI
MSSSINDEVRGVAKQFFGLQQEEKLKWSRAVNVFEGYGHDPVVSEKQVLNLNTRLFLKVFHEKQRKLDLRPENPDNFRVVTNKAKLSISVATIYEPDPEP